MDADFANSKELSKFSAHFEISVPKTSVGKFDKKVLRVQFKDFKLFISGIPCTFNPNTLVNNAPVFFNTSEIAILGGAGLLIYSSNL